MTRHFLANPDSPQPRTRQVPSRHNGLPTIAEAPMQICSVDLRETRNIAKRDRRASATSAWQPPRRPSQASSPSPFPSDEQTNRWDPVGASSAPEPTDAFPSLQLHKGGSPTVSIPLRILDLVGFMGPTLLPISGWTRMAAGSRGCHWVSSHLANPDIGESACANVLSRAAIRLATPPLAMSEPPNSAVPEPSTPSAAWRLAANVS